MQELLQTVHVDGAWRRGNALSLVVADSEGSRARGSTTLLAALRRSVGDLLQQHGELLLPAPPPPAHVDVSPTGLEPEPDAASGAGGDKAAEEGGAADSDDGQKASEKENLAKLENCVAIKHDADALFKDKKYKDALTYYARAYGQCENSNVEYKHATKTLHLPAITASQKASAAARVPS